MTKLYKIIFIICSFTLSIFFTSCPFMENLNHTKILDFELSSEEIKINMPIELTARFFRETLGDDGIFSINKLENMDITVIKGKILEYDNQDAIFVEFEKSTENDSSNNDSSNIQNPYCKLSLIFRKQGTYCLKFLHTNKNELNSNFEESYIELIMNVTE